MLSAWRRWRRPPTPSTEPESTEPETEDTEGEDHDESVFSGELTPADTLSVTTGTSTAETASTDPADEYPVPILGYHHVLMIISAISLVGLGLTLGGCSRTGTLQNFHLLSISYRPDIAPIDATSPLMLNDTLPDILHQWTLKDADEPMRAEAVQVGYWSICVKLHQGDWQCRLRQPAAHIADPLGIIEAAFDFQKHVTSSVLVILGVVFTLSNLVVLLLFPGWNIADDGSDEFKSYPSSQYATVLVLINGLAGAMLYIGMAWQHIAIASAATIIEGLRYGSVEVQIGVTAAVLGWLGALLSSLCMLGGVLMGVSLHLIDELS
ncbi:unnamed protein product [Clonostachys byssicola]|uniref:Uncharacterized protein n=1 Tax=Clonostachys byssicola TaxID=160290 RepID=A0A9N9YCX2_9HYPO|nr:unnamed protein product [Clonostachys byssicola]